MGIIIVMEYLTWDFGVAFFFLFFWFSHIPGMACMHTTSMGLEINLGGLCGVRIGPNMTRSGWRMVGRWEGFTGSFRRAEGGNGLSVGRLLCLFLCSILLCFLPSFSLLSLPSFCFLLPCSVSRVRLSIWMGVDGQEGLLFLLLGLSAVGWVERVGRACNFFSPFLFHFRFLPFGTDGWADGHIQERQRSVPVFWSDRHGDTLLVGRLIILENTLAIGSLPPYLVITRHCLLCEVHKQYLISFISCSECSTLHATKS